ncbi:DoxX family protein [Dactylosporangium sp. McL0621]|uniref:DoxX family protein n=1 Tax=Dactylosporangium sp. McL0621 TaxID=3415678 RepID=UPI003CEF0C4B
MNLALWIATGVLALIAFAGGVTKTFVPMEKLTRLRGAGWTRDARAGFVRTLGVLEVAAAVGFLVAPVLAAVTAGCWILLMVGAAVTHARRGEGWLAAVNVVYLALAAFVLAGRVA